MMNYKSAAIAASIFLAVSIPVITAVKSYNAVLSAPVIKVEIEPYDPRDLMYGHYLNFRIKWNWKNGKADAKECEGGKCYLCVGEGHDNPQVSLQPEKPDDNSEKNCAYVLEGQYYGGDTFDIGISRYYLDEDFALPLEKLFRDKKEDFFIGLVMASSRPVQEELYVGDLSLLEYIEKHKDELLERETPAR